MPESPKSLTVSALVSFVPRQVMLASKPNSVTESKIEKKKKKTKSKTKKLLLNSIAAFLESSGFEKTLTLFRSEAQIEFDDDLKASTINLEDIFRQFLDSSNGDEKALTDSWKDLQKSSVSGKEESGNDGVSEETQKKKSKHKKEKNEGVKSGTNENELAKGDNEPNNLGGKKEVENLKSAEETKDKKKKKHKVTDFDENSEFRDGQKVKDIVEEKIGELKSLIDSSAQTADSEAKHKSEKKKKLKTTSESFVENGNADAKKDSTESGSTKENDDNIEKKSEKKRKRLVAEEKTSQGENKSSTDPLESTEENTDTATAQKPVESLPDNEQMPTSKKRKTKNSCKADDLKKSSKENDSSTQDLHKELGTDNLSNGKLEKSDNECGTASKSEKKKGSAEPKTVNAFQRVKIDEVKFADERLQDNSYWALDGTGSGYGAKAQEVLGQVKGRDFRHEKTKKKRGTYRGGQIDYNARSIKFNYDDE